MMLPQLKVFGHAHLVMEIKILESDKTKINLSLPLIPCQVNFSPEKGAARLVKEDK